MGVNLKDIGRRVRCPKCGREGVVRVVKMRKKEREYFYLVVRHYSENRYCIIKRIDAKTIEGVEDVLKLVRELDELKKKTRFLEEENERLEKELMKLRIENSILKDKVGFYEDVWRKSIVITRNEKIEEKIDEIIDEIKDLLRRYDGVRFIPYRFKIQVEYGEEGFDILENHIAGRGQDRYHTG